MCNLNRLLPFILVMPIGCLMATEHKSLCTAEEQTYFSCALARKTVSICGSSKLSLANSYLQYRIGAAGRPPELEFPKQKEPPQKQLRFGSGGFFNDGGVWNLAFDIGPYSYTIYRFTSISIESSSGVAVKKDGKVISYLRCKESSVIDLISETDLRPLSMREISNRDFISGLE